MSHRLALLCLLLPAICRSQEPYFDATWKGRVGEPGPGRTWDVELKLVKVGDSVKGMSYYQGAWYRSLRMPVTGFLDPDDGSLSWWHASDYGLDEEGRRALDPMPHGIRYRLGYSREKGATESLNGTVSMSIWSGEKWQREVRFERADHTAVLDDWQWDAAKEAKTVAAAKKPAFAAGTDPKPKGKSKSREASTSRPVASSDKGKPVTASQPKPPSVNPAEQKGAVPMAKSEAKPPSTKPQSVTKTREPVPKEAAQSETPLKVAPPREVTAKALPTTATATKKAETVPARPTPPKPVASKGATAAPTTKASPPKTTAARPKPSTVSAVAPSKASTESEGVGASSPQQTGRTEAVGIILPSTVEKLAPLRSRERVLMEEVVVHGDTLWLNFYDPAEVDGDTVSVYLGDKPIATGVGLGLNPYVIGIPVVSLPDKADLSMFAENMGRIPPNTALLILYIAGERKEVRLESNDRSSATIRFLKPSPLKH
jgi:hypothetical protein